MNEFKENLIFPNDMSFEAYSNASDGLAYPNSLDMRDLVLETENQGKTSMCAAYTATSWIESIMWRKTGKPVHYDPIALYKHAKSIDGCPNEEGTSMPAIMQSMIEMNWCPGCSKSDIVYINNANQLKRAIHRYGTCLLGFCITDKWYNHFGSLVYDTLEGRAEGGHAVICTGYNNIGVFIQNSWGSEWGKYGFACISWKVFNSQFRCGAYIKNCLNDVEK